MSATASFWHYNIGNYKKWGNSNAKKSKLITDSKPLWIVIF